MSPIRAGNTATGYSPNRRSFGSRRAALKICGTGTSCLRPRCLTRCMRTDRFVLGDTCWVCNTFNDIKLIRGVLCLLMFTSRKQPLAEKPVFVLTLVDGDTADVRHSWLTRKTSHAKKLYIIVSSAKQYSPCTAAEGVCLFCLAE